MSTAIESACSSSATHELVPGGHGGLQGSTSSNVYRQLTIKPVDAALIAPNSPFSSPNDDVVRALADAVTGKVVEEPCTTASSKVTEPVCASQGTDGVDSKCNISGTSSCLLNSMLAVTVTGTGTSTSVPPHGVKAVCGKRNKMEDAFSVQTNFADVPMSPSDVSFQYKLPARIASQVGEQLEQQTVSPPSSVPLSPNSVCVASLSSSETSVAEPSVSGSTTSSNASDSGSSCDTLHFFGVYDGHGGVEAAQHCANRLHHHLSVALALVVGGHTTMHTHDAFCVSEGAAIQCQAEWNFCSHEEPPSSTDTASSTPQDGHASAKHADDSSVCASIDENCVTTFDTDASDGSGSCGDTARSDGSGGATGLCTSGALEMALRDAFLKTDEEFAQDGSSAMVGSTAVVALVGTKKMWIANCGDSRAVLCRGGKAIQVTDDHKPEREDEAERVEKAGGQVLYWNGHRVMGVLAMSRAIGDHGLRPYVIPEPEISVLARVQEDDFLLLASDGLWDVMTNQEAITLATRVLQRSWDKGTSRKAAVRVAATVLTRAAVDRGSKDNVTVVIVDLKTPQPTSSDGKQEDPATVGVVCDTPSAGQCGDVPPTPCFMPAVRPVEVQQVAVPVPPDTTHQSPPPPPQQGQQGVCSCEEGSQAPGDCSLRCRTRRTSNDISSNQGQSAFACTSAPAQSAFSQQSSAFAAGTDVWNAGIEVTKQASLSAFATPQSTSTAAAAPAPVNGVNKPHTTSISAFAAQQGALLFKESKTVVTCTSSATTTASVTRVSAFAQTSIAAVLPTFDLSAPESAPTQKVPCSGSSICAQPTISAFSSHSNSCSARSSGSGSSRKSPFQVDMCTLMDQACMFSCKHPASGATDQAEGSGGHDPSAQQAPQCACTADTTVAPQYYGQQGPGYTQDGVDAATAHEARGSCSGCAGTTSRADQGVPTATMSKQKTAMSMSCFSAFAAPTITAMETLIPNACEFNTVADSLRSEATVSGCISAQETLTAPPPELAEIIKAAAAAARCDSGVDLETPMRSLSLSNREPACVAVDH